MLLEQVDQQVGHPAPESVHASAERLRHEAGHGGQAQPADGRAEQSRTSDDDLPPQADLLEDAQPAHVHVLGDAQVELLRSEPVEQGAVVQLSSTALREAAADLVEALEPARCCKKCY